jgi:ABC-type antimicrobial peptide transport system permease subunit
MIPRQGLALSVAGLLAGLVIALGVTRLMSSLLHGVGTLDFATFTLVPIALLFVALGASFVPALRATRVDPVTALRME